MGHRARLRRPAPGATRDVLVLWLPVAAWMGLIFFLSARENLYFAPQPDLDFAIRKLGHMGIFGILAVLGQRAFKQGTGVGRPAIWAFAVAALYAASDELHQAFVATRHASLLDVGIDAAGALIALVALALLRSRRSRRARRA